jgi:hypothetical protein
MVKCAVKVNPAMSDTDGPADTASDDGGFGSSTALAATSAKRQVTPRNPALRFAISSPPGGHIVSVRVALTLG